MYELNGFRKSTPPQFVNLSFTLTDVKNKMTDSWGNSLLQNEFKNTLCKIRFRVSGSGFRVSSFGFGGSYFGIRVSGLGFRVWGLGFGFPGFGLRVSGFGFRFVGFGFGEGFRVSG